MPSGLVKNFFKTFNTMLKTYLVHDFLEMNIWH